MLLSILLFINLNLFGHKLVSSFDRNGERKQKNLLQQQQDHVIGLGEAGDNRVTDGRHFRNRRRLPTAQSSSGINNVNSTLPLLPAFIPSFADYSRKSFLKHLPQSPDLMTPSQVDDKLIPRFIWIAVKNKNDELPPHLVAFCSRNPSWLVNICDNDCKDHFMGPSGPFAGTSVSWAYFLINPLTGAAKADIWRYSVLYAYGGFYIDDDSDIATDLDKVSL
jgi:Glycosyltransferase sugar-binding region containing DXD motif